MRFKNTYNFTSVLFWFENPLMLVFPNCKINLGLYITNRRDDGYHDLETVFYPIKLRDVLEIVPAQETVLYLSGKPIAGDGTNNLVLKAFHLLQADFKERITPVDVHLLKNIPMGAGLGGGSADGAFMLRLMNDYFKLGLTQKQLIAYALQLGSDCPFFINNTPQFATGRGEVMEPIALDMASYSLQLICPEVHVSTAEAFKLIQPKPATFDLRTLPATPVSSWKELVKNDFEEPVFKAHPELKKIKDALYEQGAIYASMTGSGSSIYGIFEKENKPVITSNIKFESHYIK